MNVLKENKRDIQVLASVVRKYRDVGLSIYPINTIDQQLLTYDSAGNAYPLGSAESVEIAQFLAAAGNRWLGALVELRETLLALHEIAERTAPDDEGQHWTIFPAAVEVLYKRACAALALEVNLPERRSDLAVWLHSIGENTPDLPSSPTSAGAPDIAHYGVRCVCGRKIKVKPESTVACFCEAQVSVETDGKGNVFPVCVTPDNYPEPSKFPVPTITAVFYHEDDPDSEA